MELQGVKNKKDELSELRGAYKANIIQYKRPNCVATQSSISHVTKKGDRMAITIWDRMEE